MFKKLASAAILLVASKPLVGARSSYDGVQLCSTFTNVCKGFAEQVDCSSHFVDYTSHLAVHSTSCTGTYDTFAGSCTCAGIDASSSIQQSIVEWTLDNKNTKLFIKDSGSTDFCKSYQGACDTFLTAVACPNSLKYSQACSSTGYNSYVGTCTCGTFEASMHVQEQLIEYQVESTISTTLAYSAGGAVNFCSSYQNTCSGWLDSIACPSAQRQSSACSDSTPSTFDGVCTCGAIDASQHIQDKVVDALVASSAPTASVVSTYSPVKLDFCNSFENLCDSFNNAVNCTTSPKSDSSCIGLKEENPATFNGICKCGKIDVASRIADILIDSKIETPMNDLVCYTMECAEKGMAIGVIAIIAIVLCLVVFGIVFFLYYKGEPYVRACLASPLWHRMSLNPLLMRFRAAEPPHKAMSPNSPRSSSTAVRSFV